MRYDDDIKTTMLENKNNLFLFSGLKKNLLFYFHRVKDKRQNISYENFERPDTFVYTNSVPLTRYLHHIYPKRQDHQLKNLKSLLRGRKSKSTLQAYHIFSMNQSMERVNLPVKFHRYV
jgi:hypothetical protein